VPVKSKAIERLLGAKPKCNHYYSQAVAKCKLHVHQSIATALKSEIKKKKHESSILQPHGFLFERVNCAAKRLWKITMLKTTKELSHDQSI